MFSWYLCEGVTLMNFCDITSDCQGKFWKSLKLKDAGKLSDVPAVNTSSDCILRVFMKGKFNSSRPIISLNFY